ncbi:MAG: aldo/keto reductase family oxidoreductase [Maribacter sp.]
MMKQTEYSRIIAGAMTWGQWGKGFGSDEISDLIAYCSDIGLTTFDHADIYGGYTTEADFGAGFLRSGVPREKVQFISKCGIQFDSEKRPNVVKHYDYTKAYIIWSVEQSLKNLQTEYLDLLLLHRPSPLMEPDEISEAIASLTKDGKIKSFGVSNFLPSQIALLETSVAVSANQVEFSLTSNEVMYNGILDDCRAKNRMAMSWSPLGSYFKEGTTKEKRIEKAMRPLLEKYNVSADQLLLAWILKHPAQVRPVVGTATKSRLKDALMAMEIDLELQDWFLLLEASQGCEVP